MSEVAAGKLATVYVISSTDPLLLERAVVAVRDAAVPVAFRGFNYDVIDGRGASGQRVVAMAQTMPMLAQRRLIWVRDVGAMSAADLAPLVAYLDDPNPRAVLLATAAKVDKRLKFFATAKKKHFFHELTAPRNTRSWISEEARRLGVEIGQAAVTRLSLLLGNDLARTSLALTQLGLYAGDRSVEADDVDDLIAETRERSVFELTDSIGEGDLPGALGAVAALCEQRQSAIGVVILLARHFRQLGLCHAGAENALPKSEMARFVGAPPFLVDKLVRQTRRYDKHAVGAALCALSETDRNLKGFTQVTKTLGKDLGERVLLDRLVANLIRLAAGRSRAA